MDDKLTYIPNDDTQITPPVFKISGWNFETLNLMNQPSKIKLKSPKANEYEELWVQV